MAIEMTGLLTEKTRTGFTIGTFFAIVTGVLYGAWQLAEIKHGVDLRLQSIEIAVDRLGTATKAGYTRAEAEKDWRTQAMLTKRMVDDLADLRSRIREIERAAD